MNRSCSRRCSPRAVLCWGRSASSCRCSCRRGWRGMGRGAARLPHSDLVPCSTAAAGLRFHWRCSHPSPFRSAAASTGRASRRHSWRSPSTSRHCRRPRPCSATARRPRHGTVSPEPARSRRRPSRSAGRGRYPRHPARLDRSTGARSGNIGLDANNQKPVAIACAVPHGFLHRCESK